MSQVPTEETITFGYMPPSNTQFSVFLDNRCGKLLELVEILEGHALELVALSVLDSADHAVVRLVTSNSALASRILRRNNVPFSEAAILVVEFRPDQTLAHLCKTLLSAELNIHYAYPLLVRPHGAPVMAIHCDDLVLAGQLLLRKMFTLLGENDLGDNKTHGDPFEQNYG